MLCDVKCMIWNEVAYGIGREIMKIIKKKTKKNTIGLTEETMEFTVDADGEAPKCETGWSLT